MPPAPSLMGRHLPAPAPPPLIPGMFDVIVIGGGHAGTEAAAAAARMGARTLLLTQNLETIGQMSCNPAIGGIAKGTVVREVDALGGIMGRATDLARLQFRMLNRSKGPAVWSPRAQCDRGLYRRAVRSLLERLPNLRFAQGTVRRLQLQGESVVGVETTDGRSYPTRAVVVTAGTFLRGRIHVGVDTRIAAGRAGDAPSVELAEDIADKGLTVERFKTGTPPRIDGRTVDLDRLERQDGDEGQYWFSWYERGGHPPQLPCYLTHTGPELQEIITRHLHESALYGGEISGRGPRYCPSIEDKIVRFPHAARHQVFLEPEGLDTSEMYVNGLSTSLPVQVQLAYLHSVPGLERVEMTRPGYAIEYDFYPPTQLDHTLKVKRLTGLYFAGQINGTTGYEEAAGQGVVAGLNAAAFALEREPTTFGRDASFIGVLVDDLVTRGVDEPYRLFTSRAEFRLLLRQDNALRRMLPTAVRLGLLGPEERRIAETRIGREDEVLSAAGDTLVRPEAINPWLASRGHAEVREPVRAVELARRPGVALAPVLEAGGVVLDLEHTTWADIEIKYRGYLEREMESARRLRTMESFELPAAIDYLSMATISYESREKLTRVRPATLGQAGRIPGVSPSDLQNLVLEVVRIRGRES
ncbi:MAG TPA: tRNA uridine-5-carboxymethylaminomethyl(34) synthesis enzyme MnmG [Gemmatimonadales bacterium]|nr:tRNA uridine-5-carboxymethylaminomethyl(34) synthesis enzyme MnmG [Gemmatimonadales bacterium]